MQKWAQKWYGPNRSRRYYEEVARIHRTIKKKKDLNDQDNHKGVITHLEPDILGYEGKWVLGSITMNKASEVMEFQMSYFKSSKMML